jgi:hypothetical protein
VSHLAEAGAQCSIPEAIGIDQDHDMTKNHAQCEDKRQLADRHTGRLMLNEVDEEWNTCKELVTVAPPRLYTSEKLSVMANASHNDAGFRPLISTSVFSV